VIICIVTVIHPGMPVFIRNDGRIKYIYSYLLLSSGFYNKRPRDVISLTVLFNGGFELVIITFIEIGTCEFIKGYTGALA
jgi:hypothetical protein